MPFYYILRQIKTAGTFGRLPEREQLLSILCPCLDEERAFGHHHGIRLQHRSPRLVRYKPKKLDRTVPSPGKIEIFPSFVGNPKREKKKFIDRFYQF